MVNHCIKPALEEKVLEDLKKHKFSLLLDFATDHVGCSHFCIMTRYFKDGEIKQFILKNLEIKESVTGENILKLIETHVFNNKLFSQNFIGMSTDNAPNLSGNGVGLYSLLRNKHPHMFFQSCMSHNYDLIAEDVVKSLPKDVVTILKDISKEFAHANTKKADFEKIQKDLNLPIKTPKKWNDTRWLSLGILLQDFFVNLPAFIQYFGQNNQKDMQKTLKIN